MEKFSMGPYMSSIMHCVSATLLYIQGMGKTVGGLHASPLTNTGYLRIVQFPTLSCKKLAQTPRGAHGC